MALTRRSQVIVLTLASLTSGCAGVFAGYGPGMTNVQRRNVTCAPDSPGSSTGTCNTSDYDSGELELGIQLGARVGAATASAGDLASGTALAVDAHTDVVLGAERWGVGVTAGYTSDRLFGEGNSYGYSGFPLSAYGQFGLARKIFLHGGVGRVLFGSVKRIEPDEVSVDASAWRGFAGITFVFGRTATRDLAFRLEARTQRSADAMIDGQDARWSSTALLAELIWASF